MRILLINTFHYSRGGASIHVLSLAKLLRERGHEVFHFAMQHPQSLPCPETERFWPSYIDYPKLLLRGIFRGGLRVIRRTFYSKEAEHGMERLLEEIGPFDIAHIHNILHHLTPSVLKPLRKRNIPIVWTLHDYSLICPNTIFFNQHRQHLCSRCLKGGLRFIWAPIVRCKKSSFSASLIAALEAMRHRISEVKRIPDLYVSPSRFLIDKFTEGGFDRTKFDFLPNFGPVPPEFQARPEIPVAGDMPNGYALYAGRLSLEKGLATLIKAWKGMSPEAILRIAGTGPLEENLKALADDVSNIEFLGFVQPEALTELRRKARFAVVPSEWWENAPLTVLEAFNDGIPVLAANIGGIPEMVRPGETGELFDAGNAVELAHKAQMLWDNPALCAELGHNARRVALDEYSPIG